MEEGGSGGLCDEERGSGGWCDGGRDKLEGVLMEWKVL